MSSIKQKIGKCITCSAQGPVIAKMCQTCYWKHRHEVNKDKEGNRQLKPRKPINSKSDKQLERDIEYAKKRKEWIKGKVCAVCSSRPAVQCHHMIDRIGENLMNDRYWLPVCAEDHEKITRDSKWALEMGYSISRHKKQYDGTE